MEAVPGGTYRVRVRLSNVESLHPSWLVGALAATYPNADVMGLRQIGKSLAEVDLRWRRRAGLIESGDSLTPVVEGMMVPGLPMPSARVESAQPLSVPELAPIAERWSPTLVEMAKLGVSALLIGFVAWRASKVKAA